jgi:GAF domain-containing protein
MINQLPYPTLTDVLKVISLATESSDCRLIRQKALDALFHTISAEGAVFFLPDGNGSYTYVMLKNLEKRYSEYYRTYFHQMDPLQLTRKINNRWNVPVPLEKSVNYDPIRSSEYYEDFLRPQKIHYKLIVNLVAEKELQGRIVLTRPRKRDAFSKREMEIAKNVSPYLAHALAHHDLKREVTRKGNLLKYVEEHSFHGNGAFG